MICQLFIVLAIAFFTKAVPNSVDKKSGSFKSALRQFIEGNAYDLTNYDTPTFNEQIMDNSFYN